MDASDIFYFLCSGRGKGESEAPGGQGLGRFLLKVPGEGGGFSRRGRGRERVCGLNFFFFRGRNVHREWLVHISGPQFEIARPEFRFAP